MSAKERKRKSAKERKRAQKDAKERKRALMLRDAETTILIKFAFWRGLGRGSFTENCPKALCFFFFWEKFHDNKIWKFCEVYCQKFCCHLGGSYMRKSCKHPGLKQPGFQGSVNRGFQTVVRDSRRSRG